MTEENARALAEFVKDHDKRFEASVQAGGEQSAVLLTLAADGTPLDPITTMEDYKAAQIVQNDPGPTVRAAWDKWRPQ